MIFSIALHFKLDETNPEHITKPTGLCEEIRSLCEMYGEEFCNLEIPELIEHYAPEEKHHA